MSIALVKKMSTWRKMLDVCNMAYRVGKYVLRILWLTSHKPKNQLFHNRRWLLTKKYSYADRNNMKFNVALYQACSSVNCKFVISLSPFFISFSFRGLYRHYREYTFHHVLFPCERRISTTESNNVCLV